MGKHAFVETEAALSDERRTIRQPNLPAVGVAGQDQRDAVRFGFVKVVGVVRHQ